MYHSVGVVDRDWNWNRLTCPYEVFESQLLWLKKKHFRTFTTSQYLEALKQGVPPGGDFVLLTFDDGYLDNWVYAFPLLKKYGFSATFFISPEFVDPTPDCRPNLEDVWAGREKAEELPRPGFLSWPEMREMESQGVADVQSHALTHTWYPTGKRIVDFRHPGDDHLWVTWNAHPERKPFLQKDNPGLVRWGAPVYESAKSLEARRYFPDAGLDGWLIEYVKKNGGESFFKGNWRDALFHQVEVYHRHHPAQGHWETDEEFEARIRSELKGSKETIEQRLGKRVRILCWPGGGLSPAAIRIAEEEGYEASTLTSREQGGALKKKARPANMVRLRREGALLYGGVKNKGSGRPIYLSGRLFLLHLYHFQGRQPRALLSRIRLAACRKVCQFRDLFAAPKA
jgi:peptidoglycan/xylan/chitin deacetylase (PgdA/CDA1 family)